MITNEDIMAKLIQIEQLVELAVPVEIMAIKRNVEYELAKDRKDKEWLWK